MLYHQLDIGLETLEVTVGNFSNTIFFHNFLFLFVKYRHIFGSLHERLGGGLHLIITYSICMRSFTFSVDALCCVYWKLYVLSICEVDVYTADLDSTSCFMSIVLGIYGCKLAVMACI